jgi:hypothetical protein
MKYFKSIFYNLRIHFNSLKNRDFDLFDPFEKAINRDASKRLWAISEKWIEARTTSK